MRPMPKSKNNRRGEQKMILGQDERGFFIYDPDDVIDGDIQDAKSYFETDLTMEELKQLTKDQLHDYVYAKGGGGKYDNYDEEEISNLMEEMAKAKNHLSHVLDALAYVTSTEFGTRNPVGRGMDEKVEKAIQFKKRKL